MSGRTSERAITARIMRAVKALPNSKIIKIHGSSYIESGTPDLIACVNGVMYCFEVKAPRKFSTPLQAKRLREWRNAGAVAEVVHSEDEVLEIIDADNPIA